MCCRPPSQGPKAMCPCPACHTRSLERSMCCWCEDGRGAARAGKARSCPLPALPAARAELGTPRQAGSCSPGSRISHLAGPGALFPRSLSLGSEARLARGRRWGMEGPGRMWAVSPRAALAAGEMNVRSRDCCGCIPAYGSFISRRLETPVVTWCHILAQGLFLDETNGFRSLNAVIEEGQNITTQDCSFNFFFILR